MPSVKQLLIANIALTAFCAGLLVAPSLTSAKAPQGPLKVSAVKPESPKALALPSPQKVTQRPSKVKPAEIKPAEITPAATNIEPRVNAKRAKAVTRADFPVKRCVNIAGALEAPREGDWGYKITLADLRAVSNAGFDTIRLPVRWDLQMNPRAPFLLSDLYLTRVKSVVSQARREGLGVIIDVHHFEPLMDDPKAERERFLSLWEQIATAFQRAPETVYFELLNEPQGKMSMEQLNALYAEVIPIIRRSNPDRIIIIGGNQWNSLDSLERVKWPNDPNIVATFHDYGPHDFTHQGATWTKPTPPKGKSYGSAEDDAALKATYDRAAAFSARTGLSVFVGEYGVIQGAKPEARNRWLAARRAEMDARDISGCVFDLATSFGIYDPARREFDEGALAAILPERAIDVKS